jgi:hypothetical protein
VSQHRNSWWTLTCFINFWWLWLNMEVRPVALGRSCRYISIHIDNIKIRVRIHTGLQFEGALVLESEYNSLPSPSRPSSCCACPVSGPAPFPRPWDPPSWFLSPSYAHPSFLTIRTSLGNNLSWSWQGVELKNDLTWYYSWRACALVMGPWLATGESSCVGMSSSIVLLVSIHVKRRWYLFKR